MPSGNEVKKMPPIKIKTPTHIAITSAWTMLEHPTKPKIDISFLAKDNGFLSAWISEPQIHCVTLNITMNDFISIMKRDQDQPFIDLTDLKI